LHKTDIRLTQKADPEHYRICFLGCVRHIPYTEGCGPLKSRQQPFYRRLFVNLILLLPELDNQRQAYRYRNRV
jgi:hypothetical protein